MPKEAKPKRLASARYGPIKDARFGATVGRQAKSQWIGFDCGRQAVSYFFGHQIAEGKLAQYQALLKNMAHQQCGEKLALLHAKGKSCMQMLKSSAREKLQYALSDYPPVQALKSKMDSRHEQQREQCAVYEKEWGGISEGAMVSAIKSALGEDWTFKQLSIGLELDIGRPLRSKASQGGIYRRVADDSSFVKEVTDILAAHGASYVRRPTPSAGLAAICSISGGFVVNPLDPEYLEGEFEHYITCELHGTNNELKIVDSTVRGNRPGFKHCGAEFHTPMSLNDYFVRCLQTPSNLIRFDQVAVLIKTSIGDSGSQHSPKSPKRKKRKTRKKRNKRTKKKSRTKKKTKKKSKRN